MKKIVARAAVAGMCAVASHAACAAFGNDNLQLRLGGGLRYDSNVFRAPDGVETTAPNGKRGRGDMIETLNAGATVVIPVSRQQFYLSADVNRTQYDKFSSLNYDGQDLRAVWRWQAGSFLNGDLGATRSKYLSNFATTLGNNRNIRTTDQTFFNLNYPFTANWQVNFGATEANLRNSDPTNQRSDNDTSTQTYGLRYVTGLGNYIGLQGSTLQTHFKNLFTVAGQPFNNNYDQNSISAVVGYSPGAVTQLQGSIGRTRRDPSQPGQPETSGTTGNLLFNWRPTAKTALNVNYSRDFGPAIDIVTASSTAKTLTIAPTWFVTEKVTLQGTLRRQKRDYTDPLGLVIGGSTRRDTIDAVGLVAVYTPVNHVFVNLSAQREERKTNIAGQDYTVNVLSAYVQYAF